MPNRIITELDAGGYVYDLYGKAAVNHNGSNSGAPFVFDWIGTQAEYVAQAVETNHPDWVCFITDDVEGGLSVYTKQEIDDSVVHKSNNQDEGVTGEKRFLAAIHRKNSGIQRTGTYSTDQLSHIRFDDSNDKPMGEIAVKIGQTGNTRIELHTCTDDGSGNDVWHRVFQGWYDTSTSTTCCNLPTNTYATNFLGTASQAKWADLAEKYETDKSYKAGTLIKFGGERDITLADDKCNGVISDKPGFLLDAGQNSALPVALAGKTPIRIIGKVNKFDPITLSEIPGVGRVAKNKEQIIARTLEASDEEDEKLVMCVTKFNLD